MEHGIQRLGTQAVGLGELVVTDFDGLDGEAVERDLHGHGAGKALRGGKPHGAFIGHFDAVLGLVRRLRLRHIDGRGAIRAADHAGFSAGGLVDGIQGLKDRIGGDGGAGNGFYIAVGERQGLIHKL